MPVDRRRNRVFSIEAESDIVPVLEEAFDARTLTLVEVKTSLSTILPSQRS